MRIGKKVFNLIIRISFINLFLINTIHAEVPFTWMLGIYAIMHPAYRHLLPLNGMLWAEQCIVDALYRDGNPNNATIKLVKELFYLQDDMVSFRPTILKSKPASYWTPATIGKINAAITAYRESAAQENENDATLRAALEQIIQPQCTVMLTRKEEIATCIAAKKEILHDITQQNKALYTLIGQAQRKPSTTYAQLNQKIAELEQLETDYHFLAGTKEPIEHAIKKLVYDQKFINRALENGITTLIDSLIDSVKESAPGNNNKKYTAYATESILLTLLWKIANPRDGDMPKQDFVDYFNQLVGPLKDALIVDTDNLQKWITTQPYTKQDYLHFNQNLNALHPDMRKQYMAQHYEQTILAIKGHLLWTSAMPPIITGAGAIYTHPDGSDTEQSPDCVETSFRNFFNIILYNAEKHLFDIERLITAAQKDTDAVPLQLSQNLINFYGRHKCVTNLHASELYNAWTDVTKKIPNVGYMKPIEYAPHARYYEVKSCFPNMLRICNHLLFTHSPHVNRLPREKQLDLICDTVSRDDFMVSWEIADADVEKTQLADIEYVTLKFLINKTSSFEWQLKKGHSVINKGHIT